MARLENKVNMFTLFHKEPEVNSTPKRFFSLAISEKLVQAALWEVTQNVRVLAKSACQPYFSATDLLVKIDQCLQELGPDSQDVHQTLFHLDSSFTNQNGILPDKKALFEHVTQSLQLESLGFIANTEAVVSAKLAQNADLEQQLVVEFIQQKTIFSLYSKKVLVDRYESTNPDADFTTQFKTALVQMAGKIGVDYSAFFVENNDELAPSPDIKTPIFVNFISSLISSAELQGKIDKLPSTLPMRAEILGSDIILSFILVPSATILAKSYGWLLPDEKTDPAIDLPPVAPVATQDPAVKLPSQTDFVPTVDDNEFVTATSQSQPGLTKKMIIWAVVLALLTLIVVGFFYFLSQTKLGLSLTPETSVLTKSLEVVIDPEVTASDYDQLILPGEIITKELTSEYVFTATGTKDVGDSAHGEIELINKTTQERKFSQGTVVGDGTISFATANEVTLPAATVTSTDDGENKTFGKAKVNVTANSPGTRGNLGQDVSLQVESLSKDDYEAKTTGVFTGGTDRVATVFSEKDSQTAIADSREELLKSLAEEIGDQEDGKYLAIQSDKLKINQRVFDTKLNEEATEVTLNILATVPVIAYELTELGPLAQATIAKELPSGYTLVGSEPDVLSAVDETKTAKDGERIHLTVSLSQKIAAALDLTEIKNQILGQSLLKAENYLRNLTGVKSFTLNWSNNLYAKIFQKVPSDSGKVAVVNTVE